MAERTLTFAAATLEAMITEMERDPTVFVIGEDIAKQGGIFGQFRGLSDRFGLARVRDTPISEAAITSCALGAALTGTRPVLDIHFADFVTCAMDELINQIAKIRYMFGGQARVPLVIRAPEGVIRSAGAQHSQSPEAWFVGTPGWRVVSPSNPSDAMGLLSASIRSDDPVLYLEHKALFSRKGLVPDEGAVVPIGEAKVTRQGRDVTLISWSLSVWKCMTAAEELQRRGIEAEVIDLRTLAPMDMDALEGSVSRTHRAVVVHEAPRTCGVGAEIAARLTESLFQKLAHPVLRVANPDVPIPFAPTLELAAIPQVDDIVRSVMETIE